MKAPRLLFLLLATLLCLVAGVGPSQTNAKRAEPGLSQPSGGVGQAEDAPPSAQELLAQAERENHKDHVRALEIANQSLSLFLAAGDNVGVARAHALIARCHMAQSDLDEAVQSYETTLRIWRELNRPRDEAGVLILLGFIEARRGEWQRSISFLTQAEGLIPADAEPVKMGQIMSGLGYIFTESGLPETGLEQYQRALDYYRRADSPRDVAMTTLELGVTQYLLGKYPEAIEALQQALAAFPPDQLEAAECHHQLGRVYGSLGEHATALQHLQSALDAYTRGNNTKEVAEVLALMGQVYEQQGRVEPARRQYREALATFTRLSDRINQAAVFYALGRLELKAKRYEAAEEHLRRSIEVTENIRRVPTSSDLTAAFSATVHERYESYVECMMRRHESQPARGLDVRAFETSEFARARSLAELLRETQTNLVGGLDPQLALREKSLRQTLRVKEDTKVRMLGGEYKPEELAALDAELARLEADYRQVNEEIRAAHPAYGQLTRPVAWDLRGIQEKVVTDDQTVLVEYSLGADRSYVWAVTRDRITSRALPSQAAINWAALQVYNLLAAQPGAGNSAELASATRELGRLILSPVADELKGRSRVIVVADGALNYIPFQILPVPTAATVGEEPLIANFEVVNAPSASVLGDLRREAARRPQPAKVLAAFGNPVFERGDARGKEAGGASALATATLAAERLQRSLRDVEARGDSLDPPALGPLFYSGRELKSLREAAGEGQVFVAENYDATRERLLNSDLTQYAILHFATHGLLNSRHPENSGLVLSTFGSDGREQNGFVALQDVYSMRAPVDLVVLSACWTALGKDVRGEGLLGLTRGFMYAGASSVVASLWKVDDEATAELMGRFYTNMLREGMPPSAALRSAQNSIRQRPEWNSPHYWAAFTLQGEYRQVIKRAPVAEGGKSPYLMAGACMSLLTLSAGAAWWYRRRKLRAA